MDAQKMVTIQHQIRQNQEEFNSYVKDLTSWADDMKTNEKKTKEKTMASAEVELPPVRNSLMKKRKKKKVKSAEEQKSESVKTKKKIGAYDYRAWDKFDADAASEEVDEEGRNQEDEEYETDEEWEEQRRVLLAKEEKDKGNTHFKAGQWDQAIECYTTAIRLDPANSVLYTNRAMAQIRANRLGAAESDCSTALRMEPDNVKALFRRGIARKGIGKGHEAEALEDFEAVLKLDPDNKAAKSEVESLEKIVRPTGEVKPISKDPSTRSKKPLRRLVIDEIGFGESRTAPLKKPEPDLKEFLKQRETSTSAPTPASVTGQSAAPTPASVTCQSAAPTPASVAGQSAAPTPTSVTGQSAAPTPASVTGQSAAPTPASVTGYSAEKRLEQGSGPQSSKEFPIPANFNQFQSVFSSLKYRGDSDLNVYLLSIPPQQYQKLFGQCLEPRHVNAMVMAFANVDSEAAAARLNALRRVPRFSFLAMMTGTRERDAVRELRDRLLAASCISQADFQQIGKDFRL